MSLRLLAATALIAAPALVEAHAFDERYDLPAPLSWFIAGASAAVALSFIVAALVVRNGERPQETPGSTRECRGLYGFIRVVGRALSLPLLTLVIIAGLYGTSDPLMNIAPSMVWVVCWVGLSLVVACVGNLWPAIDPWRTVFDAIDRLARNAGRADGIALNVPYPKALGQWPAVALLLGIGWFELVYPEAAIPFRLACALLGWSAFTLAGMIVFGRPAWQHHVDVFAVYFSTLGRFAPITRGAAPGTITIRLPGAGLLDAGSTSNATVALVIAMLSVVLFDGLLVGDAWQMTQHWLAHTFPWLRDSRGYWIGGLGLLGVWLGFLVAYLLACLITVPFAPGLGTGAIARLYALTLVPIAVGYNVAHNFATLVIQLQLLIPLSSDPLGLHWNLFGTVHYKPDIGLIDARISWFIAIVAIVGGHVVSIWLAHIAALRSFGSRARAIAAATPLAVLMVLYTSISLSVIAEPLVVFTPPGEAPPEGH